LLVEMKIFLKWISSFVHDLPNLALGLGVLIEVTFGKCLH